MERSRCNPALTVLIDEPVTIVISSVADVVRIGEDFFGGYKRPVVRLAAERWSTDWAPSDALPRGLGINLTILVVVFLSKGQARGRATAQTPRSATGPKAHSARDDVLVDLTIAVVIDPVAVVIALSLSIWVGTAHEHVVLANPAAAYAMRYLDRPALTIDHHLITGFTLDRPLWTRARELLHIHSGIYAPVDDIAAVVNYAPVRVHIDPGTASIAPMVGLEFTIKQTHLGLRAIDEPVIRTFAPRLKHAERRAGHWQSLATDAESRQRKNGDYSEPKVPHI